MHRSVSFVAEESRSVQYSAEAPGRNGRVVCHVLRYHGVHDTRVRYTIAIRNETDCDAHALAFAPDVSELRNRTIIQATVAAHSDFSTTIELDLIRYGGVPTMHVELSGDNIDFALVVPKSRTWLDDETWAIAARRELAAGVKLLPVAAAAGDSTFGPDHSGISPIRPAGFFAYRSTAPTLRKSGTTAKPFVQSPRVLPAIAFFALVMTVATVWLLRPYVGALSVLTNPRAGVPIAIAYRATGIGDVNFSVAGPDATRVAGGSLTRGSGVFWLTLPKEKAARAYLVRVGVTGFLGSQSAEAYVKLPNAATNAPPAPRGARSIDPPEIRSLALARAVFHGGDTLDIYYDVRALRGSVALVDPASQITYGSSSLAAAGHSAFALPHVDSDRSFSVIVTASRGPRTIQSRVAITVQPLPSPSPSPSGIPTPESDQLDGSAPLMSAPDSAVTGRPIVVTIRGQATDIGVALVDNNGTVVGRRALTNGAGSVTFTAPRVYVPTKYEFQASYSRGAGSETLVRAITIAPR